MIYDFLVILLGINNIFTAMFKEKAKYIIKYPFLYWLSGALIIYKEYQKGVTVF